MSKQVIRDKQSSIEKCIKEKIKANKDVNNKREDFVKYFNVDKISNMDIEDYVLGQDRIKDANNFCYGVETILKNLGNIHGSNAIKFGVYYGIKGSDKNKKFRFAKKYGESYQEAFENVRSAILQLLDAGEKENIQELVKNKISPLFKGKILSTYFPERYLNIFSHEHLDYFLQELTLDFQTLPAQDLINKRETLLKFKNDDPIMKNWNIEYFTYYLYCKFGKPPKIGKEIKVDVDVDIKEFYEGKERKNFISHIRRERNSKVVKTAKIKFLKDDPKLHCEVCNFSFVEKYGEIGKEFIEAHHIIPFSEIKEERVISVNDFKMLCSNCHRMIHRRIARTKDYDLQNLII